MKRFAIGFMMALFGAAACNHTTEPKNVATTLSVSVGNNQTARVNAALPNKISVSVKNQNGQPMTGVSVTFSVSAGSVSPGSASTDASGSASTTWTLGGSAGTQTMNISAGSGLTATATATATVPVLSSLTVVSGNNQTGTGGAAASTAVKVQAKDDLGAPMSGVSVTFADKNGGTLSGASATTDASGNATLGSWTFRGPIGGPDSVVATATSGGKTLSAVITAYAKGALVTRTLAAFCSDTLIVISPTFTIHQPIGICGTVVLQTTATVDSGTSVLLKLRGMQGSLAWNDAGTAAAITQVNLNGINGADLGTFSNLNVTTEGNVTTQSQGSKTLGSLWNISGTNILAQNSKGAATSGAAGCSLDANMLGQFDPAGWVIVSSCDGAQPGGYMDLAFHASAAWLATNIYFRFGFIDSGGGSAGFTSCTEPNHGEANFICINGPTK